MTYDYNRLPSGSLLFDLVKSGTPLPLARNELFVAVYQRRLPRVVAAAAVLEHGDLVPEHRAWIERVRETGDVSARPDPLITSLPRRRPGEYFHPDRDRTLAGVDACKALTALDNFRFAAANIIGVLPWNAPGAPLRATLLREIAAWTTCRTCGGTGWVRRLELDRECLCERGLVPLAQPQQEVA